MRYTCLFAFISITCVSSYSELPEAPTANVQVHPFFKIRNVSPGLTGTAVDYFDRTRIMLPGMADRVRELGLDSLRFPSGCSADRYDWKNAGTQGRVTVDEWLAFCDEAEAIPYYCLNLQGGTEGLEGPIPPGAPLEEIIRYRHYAPNPCGYTDYHFGTLQESLDLVSRYTCQRALEGRTPILHYEMGNENWGQSKSDWPPAVYEATVAAYATAMQAVVDASAALHPALEGLKLNIIAVGFPMSGNNQDPWEYPDHQINVDWTAGVNRLFDQGRIHAVQEHFYTHGWGGGEETYWTEHNLQNIILVRRNTPNPRLGGYHDPDLAYRPDLAFDMTEWNIRCWGSVEKYDRSPVNGEFETDLSGWTVSVTGGGTVEASPQAVRHGERGALLSTTGPGDSCSIKTEVDVSGCIAAWNAVWIWTNEPEKVEILTRQGTGSPNPGQIIGSIRPSRVREWHYLLGGGNLPSGVNNAVLEIAVSGGPTEVRVDGVRCMTRPVGGSSWRAVTTDTFTQRLFGADVIRVFLTHGIRMAHFHHLFGNYGCPCFLTDGNPRKNSKIFEFYAGKIGESLVKTTVDCPLFNFTSYWDQWASNFNGIAPSMTEIPILSSVCTVSGDKAYLMLLNRSTDRPVRTTIRVHGVLTSEKAEIRSLTAEDLNLDQAEVTVSEMDIAPEFEHDVPPFTAQILTIPFDVTIQPTPTAVPASAGFLAR